MHNILAIDDEQSMVFLTTAALSKSGFNVEKAADGLEGIKKFDEGHFDLVISDRHPKKLLTLSVVAG